MANSDSLSRVEDAGDWTPAQADTIAARAIGVEGGGYMDPDLGDDTAVKGQSSTVHMVAALCFVLLNFVGEGVMGTAAASSFEPQNSQSRRVLSAVLAFSGLGFFVVFSLLSWFSGAYDDLIGGAGKKLLRLSDGARDRAVPRLLPAVAWPFRSSSRISLDGLRAESDQSHTQAVLRLLYMPEHLSVHLPGQSVRC